MSPMDHEPNSIDMNAFRKEIAELIVERGSMDMEVAMDLNELNETDARMWNRIKNYKKGSITREDLVAYRKDTESLNNATRIAFASTIIANMLQAIWGEEDLAEFRKQRQARK